MLFNEARFPDDISYGSIGGPEFSTSIIEYYNGYEQRKINRSYPRNKYNIVYGVKSNSQLLNLIEFFYAHKGKAIAFRFKDWADYQGINQYIGIGNGIQTNFQLIKTYTIETNSYTRIISKPIINTIKITVNNILQKDQYTINYYNGQVKFLIPPNDKSHIYAEYEFDVPVRFDTDYLPCSVDNHQSYSCNNIPLIEVKL
ncbi:DUF2460 domain-containing protein [Neoehrlichia mikurensis]|uniref:DUF2460 domain-containing protein n=1 Tax=Neoehrlichia mikurensis TaxID=89586 RepID=A0A9Q9BXE2_9RICK|nr:DUF2460 domain-containing protein [Neoehrlichia mikurensis]QXK91866.1 DUF2460 domain-containing protein [Neoehrlichia mikurensis]QXK93079.1 DUF2460 domain-containing protein [Neoehrlichia mikurensis]QXK93559.1 DUF2460 domain-containing protein [Neoehrlichia mikurensis]UTO55486.1 DUF2460 domain-containing protein [Neoehrlichia mikurensis]UTO56407.1 DUF2460 domain-containing protein [Neoehrlichia mikurensis]